jgi:putative transposase
MIRIAVTAAAFDAIAATLLLGSVGFEHEPNNNGERFIWLEHSIVDKLKHVRGQARAFPTSSGGWCQRNSGGVPSRASLVVMTNPFRYFNSSPEVIRLVVMMYVRYPLSLRNVEDLLAERGIDISHETVRFWWNRFGPMFAAEIRKRRVAHMRGYPQWRWHLDEVFVKINGKLCYLWRAVDHEGEVLEAVVTARRDKAAALKLLKRIMKKYGPPRSVVTDGLCSYSAAMKEIGAADRQEVGGRLNNRAENSHQPFRRRERAMQRFRSMKTLQKFSSVHAQVQNHFNQERHLITRQVYKQRRSIALAEWRALAA